VSARPLGRHASELAYQPALDGLRGIAVLAVLLYHGGVSWAQGGFLGVEAFFVLSGYLITSLLLAEWAKEGTVHLGNFWGRRARRLLPALFCVIAVTAIYEAVVGAGRAVPDFGADALATLLYVGNWHQVWTGNGYFAAAALVSPLQHTWSLAIEEQFYLVWPLLVLALLARFRRRHAPASRDGVPAHGEERLRLLLVVTFVGALASAGEMAWLYGSGAASAVNRVYYGTDTRAQGLLVGAALATLLAVRRRRGAPEVPARAAAVVGVVGAAGLAAAIALGRDDSAWLFRGGWLAFDVAVVAVIVAATSQAAAGGARGVPSPVRSLLAAWPLRATGEISYGLYLWHFPLFLWLDAQSTGVSGAALLWLRLGASFAVAVASFALVEQPIRQRHVRGLALRALTPAAVAAVLATVLVVWNVGEAAGAGPPPPTVPSGVPYATTAGVTCSVQDPGTARRQVFHVCPPLRMMLVGDSIGLTLGLQLGFNEQHYGTYVWDDARIGCGFDPTGQVVTAGGQQPQRQLCGTILRTWQADEKEFQPQVVVVEMGYWDLSDWIRGGRAVHIGDAQFDSALQSRMDAFVRALGSRKVPVVLLTVPLVDPVPLPDGSPQPQASTLRNRLINSMLQALAKRFPGEAYYFDTASELTPGGRYSAYVAGHLCRQSDGVHFAGSGPSYADLYQTYCGAHLQRELLPYLRTLAFGRRK
jgi:peptidoglycan/LPS O-acetylase OafA/YrhL